MRNHRGSGGWTVEAEERATNSNDKKKKVIPGKDGKYYIWLHDQLHAGTIVDQFFSGSRKPVVDSMRCFDGAYRRVIPIDKDQLDPILTLAKTHVFTVSVYIKEDGSLRERCVPGSERLYPKRR